MLQLNIERDVAALQVLPGYDRDIRYFLDQVADNARWAARMGVQLEDVLWPGAAVLDFGCGHGALSVAAGRVGAHVTGIDTSRRRIAFAARNAARNHADIAGRLDFQCGTVQELAGGGRFDAILSKDTFEHVGDIDGVLAAFRRLLTVDGRLYLGFAPLWYSPFGDHGFLTGRWIPWLHLLLGDGHFLEAHNAHTGRADRTVGQAGFNRLTPREFRDAFRKHGFVTESLRVNPVQGLKRVLCAPLNIARHIPPVEPFTTIGLYATLKCEA